DGVDALRVYIRAFGELLASAQHVAERHDRLEIGRIGGDQLFETCFRLIGAIERIEIERELDLRVAVQRRRQWHPLIDLVGEFRLFHRLIEIAKRQQRERMRGREIERELQVNESEIFAAAPAKRGAESIEHLCSPRLRRVDHKWELLAGFELVHRLHDERMARQCFLDCGAALTSVVEMYRSREKASRSQL